MSMQETIFNQLKQFIISGELSPGEKLNELDIGDKLKVSRTPVREAFRRLQVNGLVTFVPNKGVFVTKYPPEEIEEAYNIISILEGYAAELAAKNITEKDLKILRKYQDNLITFSLEQNNREYAEENYKFHEYITTLSHSKTLVQTISALRSRVFKYRFISVTIPGHLEKYATDHEQIIRFLEKEDSTGAGICMKEHVDFVKKILVSFLKENNNF